MIRAARLDELDEIRALFREYQAWLGIDLAFQGFAAELAGLPGGYGPPDGALLVADEHGALVGCVALRRSGSAGCEREHVELKRLFVRQKWRGAGLGRRLTEHALDEARRLGYRAVRLDTLARMEAAVALYRTLGFRQIPAYYENHEPDVVYLARAL